MAAEIFLNALITILIGEIKELQFIQVIEKARSYWIDLVSVEPNRNHFRIAFEELVRQRFNLIPAQIDQLEVW